MKKFGWLFLVFSMALPLKSWAADYVTGEFLVQLNEGAGVSALESINAQYGVSAVQPQAGVKGLYVLKVPAQTDIIAAVSAYKALPAVKLATPNYMVKALSPDSTLSRGVQSAVEKADVSAGLAQIQPAVFFDKAGMGRSGLIVPVANCQPGVDANCPGSRPSRPQNPSCQPGVDANCPGSRPSRPQNPSCQPGVDSGCGDSTNPGAGEPAVPPNYRKPRPEYPTGNPRTYPRRGNPVYDSERVISGDRWHPVTEYGRYTVDYSGWTESPAYAAIKRSGQNQGKEYVVDMVTSVTRRKYQLYWRWAWAGDDCDANGYCASWQKVVESDWGYEGLESSQGRSIQVQVNFANDSPLLPWEGESIGLSYNGVVGYDLSGAAFYYTVTGPLIDQGRGRAFITLTAGNKKMQPPVRDGVDLWLENINGTVQVKFKDKYVQYYRGEDGEVLEFQVTIKKKVSGAFNSDPVVFKMTRDTNGVWQWRLWGGNPNGGPFGTGISEPGEYYISDWLYRRANVNGDSRVSTSNWIERGRGVRISR